MQNKRVLILSVLGILLLAFLAYLAIRFIGQSGEGDTEPNSLLALSTQTLEPFATPSPVTTQTPLPGESWRFISMEENAIHQNGYGYDVGTFENVARPDILIRAMCMAPKWPSPQIGAIYLRNPYDILYPEVDNATQNLQRFQVLK